jgi:hypothetical protein
MFCGQCGAENNDGSKFCLRCGSALEQGQPVYQDTDNQPGKVQGENPFIRFMKKRWMIVAPAAAVIVVVLIFFSSIRAALSPAYAVERAVDTTMELLEKRVEKSPLHIVGVLADSAKNGKLGLSFAYEDGYGTEAAGDISVLSNSGQKNYGLTANLSLNGQDLDLTALFNNKRVAFNSSLIDDRYYGITYETYDNDIKAFAKAAELDEYTAESITNLVDSLRSVTNPADTEFTEKYGDLIDDFFKDLKPVTMSEQISVGSETINCKVVSKEITEEDLDRLLNNLYTMFKDDNEMRDYLMTYLNNNSMNIGSLYGMFGYYDYGYYDNAGETDADGVYDTILDKLRDAINSFKDAYSGKINMSYFISGDRLVRFQLGGSPEISGEKASFDLIIDLGKNPAKNDIVAEITVVDEYGYEVKLKATLASENQSGVQTNQLKIKASSNGTSESVLLKSEWTEKTGELVLSIDAGGQEYELEGNLKYTNGGFRLAFDELLDRSLGIGSLELAITAEQGVKIPNPDYLNLDKWDADLISDIENAFYDFLGINYEYYNDSYFDY